MQTFVKSRLHYQRFINPDIVVAAGLFVLFYGALLLVSPFEQSLFSIGNFLMLLAPLAITASGTTLIMIMGGFDLSAAGVISLTSALMATIPPIVGSTWKSVVIVVSIGALVGLINGLLVTLGIQTLAVTLSTYAVLSGLALLILPAPGGSVPKELISAMSSTVLNIPLTGLLILIIVALWVAFTKTRTGIAMSALGDDEAATQLSGVNTRRVKLTVYIVAGILYSLGGIVLASTTSTGDAAAGSSYQLSAFAAMALGMVSFNGGRGSVIGAIFGAGTMTALPKLLFAFGIADFWVSMCQGAVILIALTIPHFGAFAASVKSRWTRDARDRHAVKA
jgi:ribose transport system permease protein